MHQSGRPVKCFIAAVTDDNDSRLERQNVVLQIIEAIALLAEPGAGVAEDGIAAPAEVAKGNVLVRIVTGEGGLPIAEALFALDQRVAYEDDAIAVFQSERLGGEKQRQGRENNAKVHDSLFP